MGKVRRFEDLICWLKGRSLANIIYDLSENRNFTRDYELRNQIQSAAGSVMHNIAEGCDSGTDPEFIRFLKMARRSCSEVQSELYLALDRKYITEPERVKAYALADETKRLINGLISCLRTTRQDVSSVNQIHETPEIYLTKKDLPDDQLDNVNLTNNPVYVYKSI